MVYWKKLIIHENQWFTVSKLSFLVLFFNISWSVIFNNVKEKFHKKTVCHYITQILTNTHKLKWMASTWTFLVFCRGRWWAVQTHSHLWVLYTNSNQNSRQYNGYTKEKYLTNHVWPQKPWPRFFRQEWYYIDSFYGTWMTISIDRTVKPCWSIDEPYKTTVWYPVGLCFSQ